MNSKRLLKGILRAFLGNIAQLIPIFPKPRGKDGISVVIRTKDEEEWIGVSLVSLKDFADEIVVIDASTDRTPEIIEEVSQKYGLPVKLIRFKPRYPDSIMLRHEDYVLQSNIALRNASFRWIIRWDGDFVAHTSGEYNIAKLREYLLSLPKDKNFVVYIPVVNLDLGVFHKFRDGPINLEVRALTLTDHVYYYDAKRFEYLRIPYYYKPILLKNFFAIFHLRTVKNKYKILYRHFWTAWRALGDYNRFPTLQDYVRYEIKRRWGLESIDEAANYLINDILCKKLVRYDKSRFGEYPELPRSELENPRYRVIYKDGEIVGRNDTI